MSFTPPDLNTTLDFGKAGRERHVSIDRFVLHRNDDLTPEQLDALLSFARGTGLAREYNDDGDVTIAGFVAMADNFGDRFPIADSFAKDDEKRDGLSTSAISCYSAVFLRKAMSQPLTYLNRTVCAQCHWQLPVATVGSSPTTLSKIG